MSTAQEMASANCDANQTDQDERQPPKSQVYSLSSVKVELPLAFSVERARQTHGRADVAQVSAAAVVAEADGNEEAAGRTPQKARPRNCNANQVTIVTLRSRGSYVPRHEAEPKHRSQ